MLLRALPIMLFRIERCHSWCHRVFSWQIVCDTERAPGSFDPAAWFDGVLGPVIYRECNKIELCAQGMTVGQSSTLLFLKQTYESGTPNITAIG